MRGHFVSLSFAVCLFACGTSDNTGGGAAGGAGQGAGGDGACTNMTPENCITCCESAHESGSAVYEETVKACACGSGACASACPGFCDGSSGISSECTSCLQAALVTGGTCSVDPCASDADCQAYSTCGDACLASPGTTSSSSSTGTSSDPFAQARHDCVAAINADRATLGLPAYNEWSADDTCADGQAQSDSMSGTAHGAFGQCSESAQDECPGWPGPADDMIGKCLAMMWAEGPGADFNTHGHYINMSSTSYTMVSCGFTTLSDGSVWAVQDFK